MNDWICTSGHGLLILVHLPPHILGHSPLHSLDQVLDEKAVDVSQGMVVLVITLSSWEGWWRTNTACQAGWLGVALLLVVLGSWRRHHWGLVHCCTLFLWRQHWGHEGRLGAGWSVGVGACDADGDRIGKVAVGVMDAIEMVVDEQAELGVYQVLAKQM